jgi:uncharacterized protein with GYD domain
MPKYVILFGLTSEALARFIDNPEDRRGPVSQLAEAMGGRLESYYWMFGKYDGLAIFEAPDSRTMASLALAATSTGVFRSVETHELIAADELVTVLQRAKTARPTYRPPGGSTP